MKNDNTNDIYSISEFAKVCGTTKDTLYHYEKQGILIPATDENNHYRYYSINDFHLFQFIAHLRRLGFSISEIRECVKNRSVPTYMKMLEQSQSQCLEEISEAKRRHAIVTNAKEAAFEYIHILPETPGIKYAGEEYYYITDFKGKLNSLEGIRHLHDHLVKADGMPAISSNLIVFKYDVNTLTSTNENSRLYMMTQTPDPKSIDPDNLHVKPAGYYLHIFFRMDLPNSNKEEAARCFRKMQDYVRDHNYRIVTDLYCYNRISSFLTDNPEEYITEVCYAVK